MFGTTSQFARYHLSAGTFRKKDKYKRMKPEATASRLTDVGEGGSLKRHLTMGKVSPFGGSMGE